MLTPLGSQPTGTPFGLKQLAGTLTPLDGVVEGGLAVFGEMLGEAVSEVSVEVTTSSTVEMCWFEDS